MGEVDFWFMKCRSFVIANFLMNLPVPHKNGEFSAVLLELRLRIGVEGDRVATRERECSVGWQNCLGVWGHVGCRSNEAI